MADTDEESIEDWPPTALSVWLDKAELTANKLASEANITPRAVYALARGGSDLVAPKTLIAVSNYTGLTIDNLVRPYYNAALATDTGDSRFNLMLAKLGRHMHSNRCESKLAPYISAKFRCGGSEYERKKQQPMTFRQMCIANAANKFDIHSVMMSSHWYNTGTTRTTQSRTLLTYWRALVTDREAHTTTDTTFVAFEFEKSIEEMGETEMRPQITSWWWHRPTELNAELADRKVDGFIHEEVDRAHNRILNNQFASRVTDEHLSKKQKANK